MNLAHAVVHHPLRDASCWGVKVFTGPRETMPCFMLALGSYTYGKVVSNMTLRMAAQCYVNALATWQQVHLIRLFQAEPDGIYQLQDDQALVVSGYQPPPVYERLHSIGAILPASIARQTVPVG